MCAPWRDQYSKDTQMSADNDTGEGDERRSIESHTRQMQRRDEKRATAEIEADRAREASDREREARGLGSAIAAAERKAQKALMQRPAKSQTVDIWNLTYHCPSPRSIRRYNGLSPIGNSVRPCGRDGAVSFHLAVSHLKRIT
jgi:hypothetical protein